MVLVGNWRHVCVCARCVGGPEGGEGVGGGRVEGAEAAEERERGLDGVGPRRLHGHAQEHEGVIHPQHLDLPAQQTASVGRGGMPAHVQRICAIGRRQ
jgi:hypothetical protein